VHHSTTYMCPIVADGVSWSVGQSVCHDRKPCRTGEPFQMPFGLWTVVGARNHVLDGCPDPHMWRGQFWRGKGQPIVKYRDLLLWAVQKWLNRSICCFWCDSGGPRKHILDVDVHWRYLANTTEPSTCGGDEAFLSDCFDHLSDIPSHFKRVATLPCEIFGIFVAHCVQWGGCFCSSLYK